MSSIRAAVDSLIDQAAALSARVDAAGSPTWRKVIDDPGATSITISTANAKEYKRYRDKIEALERWNKPEDQAKLAKLRSEYDEIYRIGQAAHERAPIKMTYAFGSGR